MNTQPMTTPPDSWHETASKLPLHGQLIYFCVNGLVYPGFFKDGSSFPFNLGADQGGWGTKHVTHWMPRELPAPPAPKPDAFEQWWNSLPVGVFPSSNDIWNAATAAERSRFAEGVEKLLLTSEFAWPPGSINALRALAKGEK